MNGLIAIVTRDIRTALSGGTAAWGGLMFFLLVVTLFPFTVGPAPQTLARIAPGVVWVAALLACLLGLERLFQPDADDGTLEQFVVHGLSLEAVAIARFLSHWVLTALPLLVLSPVAAVLLQLPTERIALLMASLAIGTPGLSALGVIAAGVTVGVRRGGVLAALIVLPIAAPVLIFGVASLDPMAGSQALTLLAACSLVLLALSPFAAGYGLRLALE
jgi:heme exporter protein B